MAKYTFNKIVKHGASDTNLRISNIVQRMPLTQRLSDSQSMLVKLSPAWSQWSKANLSGETEQKIHLSSFENHTLTIHCDDAIKASQVKHQQHSLLMYLIEQGFHEVKQLSVRISHPAYQTQKKLLREQLTTKTLDEANLFSPKRPSKIALDALRSCQLAIINEPLCSSVNKLEQTLSSLPPEDKPRQ